MLARSTEGGGGAGVSEGDGEQGKVFFEVSQKLRGCAFPPRDAAHGNLGKGEGISV